MGTITPSWKPNNDSDLNQSVLRKTENPPLSGYGHCTSVRNITEILKKPESLVPTLFSELLLLRVSCKASYANILAQRKYPCQWYNPLQVSVLNWKPALLVDGVIIAEHIVECRPGFPLRCFSSIPHFQCMINWELNWRQMICWKLDSHGFLRTVM